MTESADANPQGAPLPSVICPPFPAMRLLYAIGFGVAAWFAFWLLVILAAMQFAMVALNGKVNEELRDFCARLGDYLWELVAYMSFVRDEQPFPLGPFPRRK